MQSTWISLLAFLSLFPNRSASLRLLHKAAHASGHSKGLEEEHAHLTGWPVSSKDRDIISKIVALLNPPDTDVPWTWEFEEAHWTYDLVKLTNVSYRDAIAMHMLHRHGLAPLTASRHPSFKAFHGKRLSGAKRLSDLEELALFVESEEKFQPVVALRGLLEQLSLNGIRNLHGWDHAWGRKAQENFSIELVQACMSQQAGTFMMENGFTEQAIQIGKRQLMNLKFTYWAEDYEHMGRELNDQWNELLLPEHTGNMSLIKEEGRQLLTFGTLDGKYIFETLIAWGAGGKSRVKVPVTREESMELQSSSSPEPLALDIIANWEDESMKPHKIFMSQNRLKVWVGEEAEFAEMTRKLLGGNIQ